MTTKNGKESKESKTTEKAEGEATMTIKDEVMEVKSEDAVNEVGSLEDEGFEDEERTLTAYPVLALAQSQTPEVLEGNIEGLRAGVLMSSVTKEPLGEKLELVAYRMWKSKAKMPPRSEGSFPECYSVDGAVGSKGGKCAECPYPGIKSENCREQKYFIVAPIDEPNNLMRLIFWKSSISAGRKLSKILQAECGRHQLPIYGMTFILTAVKKKNTQAGSIYYVYEVAPGKILTKEEILALRPHFLTATNLRNKNVEDFYAYIEANKAEGDQTNDEFAEGLNEAASTGIEDAGTPAAQSGDALM